MDELKSVVAENLKALRTTAGLTQGELAERLNYSDKAVSKWERGESLPDVQVLKQLADMYGVGVDYLLSSDHKTDNNAACRIGGVACRNNSVCASASVA